MLGYASISTTTIYTQVSIRKLKEVYSQSDPARLEWNEREFDEPEQTEEDVPVALIVEARTDPQ